MKGVDGEEILVAGFEDGGNHEARKERGLWEQTAAPAESQRGNGDSALQPQNTDPALNLEEDAEWLDLDFREVLGTNPIMPCADIPTPRAVGEGMDDPSHCAAGI